MQPCKYYKAGNCTNGKSCPWPHSDKKAKPNRQKAKAYFGIAVGAGVTGDEVGDTLEPQDGEYDAGEEDDLPETEPDAEGSEEEEQEGEEDEESSSVAETEPDTEEETIEPPPR